MPDKFDATSVAEIKANFPPAPVEWSRVKSTFRHVERAPRGDRRYLPF